MAMLSRRRRQDAPQLQLKLEGFIDPFSDEALGIPPEESRGGVKLIRPFLSEEFVAQVSAGLDPTALDEQTAKMEASFTLFAQEALKIFVPNEIHWNWAHDAICEHLQAVTEGQIKNLIINCPPRNLKSSLVSVCWNAWEWIRNPSLRYLTTSYEMKLATRDAVYTRDLIKSRWYQTRWGHIYQLKRDQDAKTLFENNRNGRRLASSVTAGNTGEGGERIVVDDPINALRADSELEREQVLFWWNSVMSSRVNQANASKVITAQRTHHADLVGSIVDLEVNHGGEHYERLVLPMQYDPRLYIQVALPEVNADDDLADVEEEDFYDDDITEPPDDAPRLLMEEDRPSALIPRRTVLGFVDPRTEPGQLLVPEQWPQSFVDQQIVNLGPFAYSAQYQQAPSPSEGGQFKEHYWQRYELNPMWHRGLRPEVIVVDSAYGEESGDPTGCAVWGMLGGRLYVIYAVELREDTPGLRRKLRDLYSKWKVPFLVEDKANGKPLIQDLRRGSDDGNLPSLPVIAFKPDGMSKTDRAHSVVSYVAGGLVYLPEGAPWVYDFIEQHRQFPKGQHDDLVDTTAMAITWLAKKTADIGELMTRPMAAPFGQRMSRTAAPSDTENGGYWRR